METIDALILKASPYSETTLLVTLLTRDHGVLRAMAKGARRARNQAQAAMEPLARIQASLRQKSPEALGNVFNPELIEGWPYLRRDVTRLAYVGLGIEVLGGLAANSPPEPFYFEEAVQFLRALENAAGPGSLTIALLLRLLRHAGFPPQLAEPWTEQTIPPLLTYHFDRGALDRPRPEDSPHAMRLAGAALAPLLGALRQPPPLDSSFEIGAQAGASVLRWLVRVWEDHLGAPLKSAQFLEKMVLAQPAPRRPPIR